MSPIRKVLLHVPTFPDAISGRTLESACALVRLLGSKLTVQVPQLDRSESTWPAVMGAFPLDFPQLMTETVLRSEANAAEACENLTRLCAGHGISFDLRRVLSTLYAPPALFVDLARLHDLVILPLPEGFDREYVEAAIFDSGRPVVLIPSTGRPLTSLNRILLAWDYSREAARALSDSLPILARAPEVHVVTVLGEREIATTSAPTDLETYLGAHGVKFKRNRIELDGKNIGECLMRHAAEIDADMVVMGAYGHNRLREFVLGGATQSVLRAPSLPVFLSH
ncbi:MAG TPA: universal stress protein [Rhizomicrobium sp.]|nr:universal stress protein [Rhizomicrobium sp.]